MKNILSDTDFAKGHDNRFGNSLIIGRVSEIDCTQTAANVRVIMPDKVDRNQQPLITKPIPVLHPAAAGKKSFQIPRVGTNVAIMKLPNGIADYLVIGSFYTTSDPPPVTDPKLDYTIYDDGSIKQFDANAGDETWTLKGKIGLTSDGDISVTTNNGKMTLMANGDVVVESSSGKISLQGSTSVDINAPTVNINGNIQHTGNMNTNGVHHDSNGVHH